MIAGKYLLRLRGKSIGLLGCLLVVATAAAQTNRPILVKTVRHDGPAPNGVGELSGAIKKFVSDPEAIDLRIAPGTGYLVDLDTPFHARSPSTGKAMLISGVILEILATKEIAKVCQRVVKPCITAQVMVRIWGTSLNPDASQECACVPKRRFQSLRTANHVPGFPTPNLSIGKSGLKLFPQSPELKVYRVDGTTANPSSFKDLMIQDLGPSSRDAAGNAYRFARFFREVDGQMEPISEESDNIYLIRDGGAIPSAQSVLAHAYADNIYRYEVGGLTSNLNVEKNRIDERMQFVPSATDATKGKIYHFLEGQFKPLNSATYGLRTKHQAIVGGFRDIRSTEVTIKHLGKAMPTLQHLPNPAMLEEVGAVSVGLEQSMADTMNRYISSGSERYSEQDMHPNRSGKIQMKFFDRPVKQGVYQKPDGYDPALALDSKGPTGVHGVNYLHYNPVASERDDRDMWGQPATVCAVHVFAAEWKRKCVAEIPAMTSSDTRLQMTEACSLQIGDLSLSNLDGSDKGDRCALGHASHYAGNCVDIRPFNKEKLTRGYVANGSKTDVDTDRVLAFAKSIGAIDNVAGWNPIWQRNDHFDHFHVCFPTQSPPHAAIRAMNADPARKSVPSALEISKNPDVAARIKDGPLRGCYGI